MYIGTLFNEEGLFQRLAAWKEGSDNDDRTDFDRFLFRATSAYISLLRMHGLNDLCIEQYGRQKSQLTIKDNRIIFWSPTLVELLNEFSPYLSSLRIMQNMVLPLTAKSEKLKTSIPTSMADAMKKLDSYGFSQQTCNLVEQYWRSGGAEIKNYRDIDQHFYAIVQRSFLQIKPVETILVYLPDNPEEKSINRVIFDNKRDAIPFFKDAFVQIHQLIEDVALILGFGPTRLKQSIHTEQLGELQEGAKKTLALIMPSTEGSSGIEIGQTADCRMYVRALK